MSIYYVHWTVIQDFERGNFAEAVEEKCQCCLEQPQKVLLHKVNAMATVLDYDLELVNHPLYSPNLAVIGITDLYAGAFFL